MNQKIKSAVECANMIEVRAGVDVLDRKIVTLLAERFDYMAAAARIKPDRSDVRDEARKAEVIANVKELALASDIPVELVGTIWELLVEGSIAYEFDQWDSEN